jgi:hypothetical protein
MVAGWRQPPLRSFLGRLPGKGKRAMSEHLLEDERKLGAEHGILTLALGWKTRDKKTGAPGDESFEAFVESVTPAA